MRTTLSRHTPDNARKPAAPRLPIAAGLFGESLEGHAIATCRENRGEG